MTPRYQAGPDADLPLTSREPTPATRGQVDGGGDQALPGGHKAVRCQTWVVQGVLQDSAGHQVPRPAVRAGGAPSLLAAPSRWRRRTAFVRWPSRVCFPVTARRARGGPSGRGRNGSDRTCP